MIKSNSRSELLKTSKIDRCFNLNMIVNTLVQYSPILPQVQFLEKIVALAVLEVVFAPKKIVNTFDQFRFHTVDLLLRIIVSY